ncbi:MAG: DinB family protein [Acidobacteriota bacterium]
MAVWPFRLNVPAQYRRVLQQLDRLLDLARTPAAFGARAPSVSAWSVAQHVEHMVRVDRSVIAVFERGLKVTSDESLAGLGRARPHLSARITLAMGRMPRGRARSPRAMMPVGREPEALHAELEGLIQQMEGFGGSLDNLARARWSVEHPVFGPLDPALWLRFMVVHDRHHLRIIDEILRAESSSIG